MQRFILNTNIKILVLISALFLNESLIAQNSTIQPIQFSGVVFTQDSNQVVPYTTLYVPKTGRGVISNQFGIFTLPVLPNDSLVIIATGFKKTHFKIPTIVPNNSMSVMIVLQQDTLDLPLVEVFPYQTEEIFKQAFLALNIPDNQSAALNKTLNDRIIAMMSTDVPSDGQLTHKWYAQQYAIAQQQKYQQPGTFTNYFNPIAWAQFINSLRKGKYKKKEYDEKGNLKSTK